MAKRPGEVFGYSGSDKSKEARSARERYWCRFTDRKCYKQSRLIGYPMGVCSAEYNGDVIALCPRRFLEAQKVFQDITDEHFGTRNDLLVFSEVGLKSIGTFDYVMVKHLPMSTEIEGFAVIEFQTGQTTGTGKLVQGLVDAMEGRDISSMNYPFGLNLYDIWKRSFTQILSKGIALESWDRKIYWVVQEQVFQNLVNRYALGSMKYQSKHSTVFSTYDIVQRDNHAELVHVNWRSSSVDDLFQAFRRNANVPKRGEFESALKDRVRAQLGFALR